MIFDLFGFFAAIRQSHNHPMNRRFDQTRSGHATHGYRASGHRIYCRCDPPAKLVRACSDKQPTPSQACDLLSVKDGPSSPRHAEKEHCPFQPFLQNILDARVLFLFSRKIRFFYNFSANTMWYLQFHIVYTKLSLSFAIADALLLLLKLCWTPRLA